MTLPPTSGLGESAPLVLLVDDEHAIRELLSALLEASGYRVLTAEDGQVGVDRYLAGELDGLEVIVSDVVMPRLTGTEMMQQLRGQGCTAPVLFISAYPHRHTDAAEAANEPVTSQVERSAFLAKPFRTPELLKVIESLRKNVPVPTPAD